MIAETGLHIVVLSVTENAKRVDQVEFVTVDWNSAVRQAVFGCLSVAQGTEFKLKQKKVMPLTCRCLLDC